MIQMTRYIAKFKIRKKKLYKYEPTRYGLNMRYIHHASDREKEMLQDRVCICIYHYQGHNLEIERVYKYADV